jgi:hypothetical protein
MKAFRIIGVILCMTFTSMVFSQKDELLLPVKQNGKWGYINDTGKIVIEPVYSQAFDFKTKKYAIVKQGTHFGIIDKKGKILLSTIYDSLKTLNDSVLAIQYQGLWGIMTIDGKMILPCAYDALSACWWKHLLYRKDGLLGLLSISGKIITPAKYDEIVRYDSVFFTTKLNRQIGLIDTSGYEYLQADCESIEIRGDNIIMFEKDGKSGFITVKNRKRSPVIWNQLMILTDDGNYYNRYTPYFIKAEYGEKYGLYSWKCDSLICDTTYDDFFFLDKNFAAFKNKNKFGLVNAEGKILSEAEYASISYIGGKYFLVENKNKVGILDSMGKLIIPEKYNDLVYLTTFKNGSAYFKFQDNNEWGLIDDNGKEITSAAYENIGALLIDYFEVEVGDRHGILSNEGKEVTDVKYDDIVDYNDKISILKNDSLLGVFSNSGKLICDAVFPKITVYNDVIKVYDGKNITVIKIADNGEIADKTTYTNARSIKVGGGNYSYNASSSSSSSFYAGTLVTASTISQSDSHYYKWFFSVKDNKWGLKDSVTSKILIKPMYDKIKYCTKDGLALVEVYSDTIFLSIDSLRFFTVSKCGLVDRRHAKVIAEPCMLSISLTDLKFKSDRIVRCIDTIGQQGYIDIATGKTYFGGVGYIDDFKNRLARINVGGKLKLTNEDDPTRLCLLKDYVKHFTCRVGYCNDETRDALFSESTYLKCDTGKWGYMYSNKRAYKITPAFDFVSASSGENTYAYVDGKWMFLDYKNPYVHFKYDYLDLLPSSNGVIYEIGVNHPQYGFINMNGELVTDIKYQDASDFHEGYAAIEYKGLWGFVNSAGTEIVEPKFSDVHDFSEGLAAVKIKGKWGFIDSTGTMVIKNEFNKVGNFSDGKVWIRVNGKYGYLDKDGNKIINAQYAKAENFNNGQAIVKINNEVGVINDSSEWVVKPGYDKIFQDSATGFYKVIKHGLLGLIDTKGKKITPVKYNKIGDFNGGLAYVCKKGKYGFIDSSGNIVVKMLFSNASDFHNGLARVLSKSKYGYINSSGEYVIDNIYTKATDFSEGYAFVAKASVYSIINSSGRTTTEALSTRPINGFVQGKAIVANSAGVYSFVYPDGNSPFQYNMTGARDFNGSRALIKYKNKWCVINSSGEMIIAPKYDCIYDFKDGIARVNVKTLKGIADAEGKIFIEPQFSSVELVKNNILRVQRDDYMGYMTTDGKYIWEPTK